MSVCPRCRVSSTWCRPKYPVQCRSRGRPLRRCLAGPFVFHLAELEVRQHSSVHTKALEEVLGGGELSDQTEEVLATLRVIGQIQQRFGPEACRRYVVSFTRTAAPPVNQ